MSEPHSLYLTGSHDLLAPVDVTSARRRSLEAISSAMPLHKHAKVSRSWEESRGSHELSSREPTHVSVYSVSGNMETPPALQREPSAAEMRAPRYQGGSYKTYEEMLANMDADDPFSGVAPPPREKSEIRKPSSKPPPRPPRPVSQGAAKTNGNKEGIRQRSLTAKPRMERGSKESRLKPPPAPTRSATIGPADDTVGELNSSFVSDDFHRSFRHRPGSARSTATYVIEAAEGDRRDSRADLIPAVQPTGVKLSQILRNSTIAPKKPTVVNRMRANSMGYRIGGNESAISRYIQDNISQRECSKYVHDLKKDDGRCQCGRVREWHSEAGMRVDVDLPANHEWRPNEEHTRTMDSNCFGTIHFQGFGQESTRYAPYVRVDYRTSPEVVWTLLSDYWRIPAPKLIISVTGGAKRFYMKNRLKNNFKRGLINAARTTGAWIVTGGTNTGVMEFVGEAAKDHALSGGTFDQQVVALGIATWGIVDNKESLESEDGHGLFPAVYHCDHLSSKSAWGLAPLDCNHTHFILVDDGTEKKFGKEIKFRAALEHYISESMETGITRNQSVHVPVVLLVLEGGENTLMTAAQEMMRNIPVVIIQGSGRAADFIAHGYRVTKGKDEEKSVFTSSFDVDFKKHAEGVFDWSRVRDAAEKAKKVSRAVADLRAMLEKRRLLTVYGQDEVDSTTEIDQAILLALLKANRSDAQTQLNLALAWNRCDVARSEIFSVANRALWQKMNLHSAMATALVQNRVDFVKLFLDSGVSLSRFLTIRRLRDLYDDVLYDQYTGNCAALIRSLLQWIQNMWTSSACCVCCRGKKRDDTSHLLYAVGHLISYLFGGQHGNMYKANKFVVQGKLDKEHTMESMLTTITSVTSQQGIKTQRFHPDLENPERELFLWAVLMNRQELAKLFWKLGQDHIGAALYGSALLKALARQADIAEEIALSAELLEHSSALEEKAVGVLTECYRRDKTTSHQLLVREVPTWGNQTLLALADSAQQMDFINHASVQTILNRIWCGKMALYTATWKILGSMVLPFLVAWIKFSPSHHHQQQNSEASKHNESFEYNNDVTSERSFKMNSHQVVHEEDAPGEGGSDDERFVKSAPRDRGTVRQGQLLTVGCCGDPRQATISFWKALFYYHTAPITKFLYYTVSYLLFLLVFSYLLMIELSPGQPGLIEYLVWGWAATFIMEEIRQMLTMKPVTFCAKFQLYFRNIWNRFDTAVHCLLVLCILLRYTLHDDDFQFTRMVYAGTLVLYYLRFLQNFYSAKNIGPKVIMIRRMMTDLVFFLAILVIMILAYGVATQALRYPNSYLSWGLLRNILYYSYWQMYGELFLEELEGGESDCSHNATIYNNDPNIVRCPERPILVILLLVFYMIMTNVLLLNILIAMFSYTFQQVQDNSEKVWRFYRYSLIYEFFDKPTFPPPLIVLNLLFRMIKYLRSYCGAPRKLNHDFCQTLSLEANQRLTAFERVGMEDYLFKLHKLTQDLIDVKVHTTVEKLEKVIENLEAIKEQVSQTEPEPAGVIETSLPFSPLHSSLTFSRYESHDDLGQLRQRITGIEEQLSYHSDQMGQLLDTCGRILDKQEQLQQQQQRTTSPTVTPMAWPPMADMAPLEPQVEISDPPETSSHQ